MWRFLLVVAALALVTMAGCETIPAKEVRIENVERIFMHERGHYTFLVRTDDDSLKPITIRNPWDERFITDVPDGMPAWATYQQDGRNTTRVCSHPGYTLCNLVIHLHDTKQLYTAGWDHGKFGSGTTNIIE